MENKSKKIIATGKLNHATNTIEVITHLPKEYYKYQTLNDRLIILLANNKGRVVTYDEIRNAINEFSFSPTQRIQRVISELRAIGFSIHSIRNVGYEYKGYKYEP